MNTTRRAPTASRETSPYLLQHAFNPVDWYPWGDEAFAKARSEDKPTHIDGALPHVRALHTAHFARGAAHEIDPPPRCGFQRMWVLRAWTP
jgi:hypothetical protein